MARRTTDHTALYLGLGAAALIGGIVLLTRRSGATSNALPGALPGALPRVPGAAPIALREITTAGARARLTPRPHAATFNQDAWVPQPIAATGDISVRWAQQELNTLFVFTPPLFEDGRWSPETANALAGALLLIAATPEGSASAVGELPRLATAVRAHPTYDAWVAAPDRALFEALVALDDYATRRIT